MGVARCPSSVAGLLAQLAEHVERAALTLLHRRLEARHEAVAEVEDERGVVDGAHVGGGELEVVRLGPGRRQVPHLGAAAGDLLGGKRERIEGGHDLVPLAASRAAAAAAGRQHGDGGENGRATKENDSRKHCRSLARSKNRYH